LRERVPQSMNLIYEMKDDVDALIFHSGVGTKILDETRTRSVPVGSAP
jgi:hypothetical protein